MISETQRNDSGCCSSQCSSEMADAHAMSSRSICRLSMQNQLQVLDFLAQPIWVYDFLHEKDRWTNQAGLEFWDSPNQEEHCSRDRTQGRSASTVKKLQMTQAEIEQDGGMVQARWTMYPKGVAKTVDVTVTGIWLDCDKDKFGKNGHCCMLFHAVPVEKESLEDKSLRAEEMLRHLPMAVCQFDMAGNSMFQNRWAQIPGESSSESASASSTRPESTSSASEKPLASSASSATATATATATSAPPLMTDFLRRFANPKVAQEALQAIQTTTEEVLHLEAELRSTTTHLQAGHRRSDSDASACDSSGGEWSDVSLRKTTDPVTGKPVILFSAQDKSDRLRAKKLQASKSPNSWPLWPTKFEHHCIKWLDALIYWINHHSPWHVNKKDTSNCYNPVFRVSWQSSTTR